MMRSEEFISLIEIHFNSKLPFVAYRKPNQVEVKAILQPTDEIYYTDNFSESGFVFSPFDTEAIPIVIGTAQGREDSILIPIDKSKVVVCENVILNVSEESHSNLSEENPNKEYHIKLVKKAIDSINARKIKKVVVSRSETVKLSETNPIKLFKRLLQSYKTALVYCWYHPKIGLWLGATPETLVKIEGNRFETMALAGTQNYSGKLDVVWGDKEKEEQQLVTDFVVNSLKPLVDSLKVSKVNTVKAGNLLHLKTQINATLDFQHSNFKNLLNKLHPTPAICGIPREAAYQFIINNENYDREFYTGFLGELNVQKKITRNPNRRNVENSAYSSVKKVTDLYVNLRCMQIKNNKALIYVGGGITKSSDPEKEWLETVNKSKTIKKVLTKRNLQ